MLTSQSERMPCLVSLSRADPVATPGNRQSLKSARLGRELDSAEKSSGDHRRGVVPCCGGGPPGDPHTGPR